MKKRTIALVLSALMLLTCIGLAACSGDTEKDGGTKATLKVGFDSEFPPMGFKDENGSYVGFDLDLAKEVAKRLNMDFKAQPIVWDSKDSELDTGTVDCIWNGFTMTGRENDYTWTDAYLDNAQVLVVKGDSAITSVADMAGKTMCVQADSSAEKALDKKPEVKATFKNVTKTDSYETALLNLKTGACDGILMDIVVAQYKEKNLAGEIKIVGDAFATEEYGVGFKLGNTELRDKVQKTLEDMAKDGTMAKISTQWFGKDITTIGK